MRWVHIGERRERDAAGEGVVGAAQMSSPLDFDSKGSE